MDELCEEQGVEKYTSLNDVKRRIYDDLHDIFLYIVQSLLHKFIMDKGVGNIVNHIPPLRISINFDGKT
jgi:hypothetical protein